ncbi:MAG: TetR/AcrR family transcriptional regulator [Streptosporangiaceae bacterium]
MATDSRAPTGLARRGRRLPDRETERRMLQAAMAMVHRTGLTVSLDHISFEDVIRDADVSRSAVYRRWPYKDLFFSDLVRELAKDATPAAIVSDEIGLIRQIAAERLDWLETAEGRRALMLELFRQLSLLDFRALYGSPQWRTYLALHATFMSLADGDLRDEVQAILARSERERMARVAAAWERMTALFGYRLRAGATFAVLAMLLNATLRGLTILALSMPELTGQQSPENPFGASGDWSLAAIGLASTAITFLEPDPAVEWDGDRIAAVRQALRSLTLPDVP